MRRCMPGLEQRRSQRMLLPAALSAFPVLTVLLFRRPCYRKLRQTVHMCVFQHQGICLEDSACCRWLGQIYRVHVVQSSAFQTGNDVI